MFFYWASSVECGPRRRKRSRLAAQRRPHRKSIECCHGSSRGKQKKQRTGTSSSSSVITESRGRACSPSVSLLRSLPPREDSRGLSEHPGRIHFSSGDGCFWGAAVSTSFGGVPRPVPMLSATRTDARGKACSVDAGGTVLLHTPSLLAVPRNHGNETAACGGYRAHLRAVTANNGPLSVARSNPRNRRPVRAWDTTGATLFSHSQMHPHAET
ncbi:hypothetical protein TcG_11772, partial [Trypanosoma cruzi]